MRLHTTRLASFALLSLLAACGGKTIEASGDDAGTSGVDSGGGGGGGGGTSDGGVIITPGPTSTCINIELTSAGTSCTTTADCTDISVGQVCSDGCNCGFTPANTTAEAAYQAALEDLPPSTGTIACACPAATPPTCLAGQCVVCDGSPESPGSCFLDAGGPSIDAGESDGGTITLDGGVTTDGGTCVFVDPSLYSTSCNADTDCTSIQTGDVCDGTCACSGTAVNVSGQAMYEEAVSGIQFAECECPAGPIPHCIDGTCLACGDPSNPCPALKLR